MPKVSGSFTCKYPKEFPCQQKITIPQDVGEIISTEVKSIKFPGLHIFDLEFMSLFLNKNTEERYIEFSDNRYHLPMFSSCPAHKLMIDGIEIFVFLEKKRLQN